MSYPYFPENNVSAFLHLLKSYIKDSGIGEDSLELCRCVPIIGAILQRVISLCIVHSLILQKEMKYHYLLG